jgi:hypothetical protein
VSNLPTATVRDVSVDAPGLSARELEEVVANTVALGEPVPGTVEPSPGGDPLSPHRGDDRPAVGWVHGWRIHGGRLLCDFAQVPRRLAARLSRRGTVELRRAATGRVVVAAVAWGGLQPPGTLDELHTWFSEAELERVLSVDALLADDDSRRRMAEHVNFSEGELYDLPFGLLEELADRTVRADERLAAEFERGRFDPWQLGRPWPFVTPRTR